MKPPRGTRDLLPPFSERFADLESRAAVIFERAGYRRIVTPVFEEAASLTRGIGERSDIVQKETYTFTDRGGTELTLRPEGTAPVMRALVTHRLWDAGRPVKLYYAASMFRYERPQKGRFRQHHQLGIEAVGSEDPALDAEVVALGLAVLRAAACGEVRLLLNSMGHPECRAAYRPALVSYLERHRESLCDDCRRRMESNPLRAFDCKVPRDREILDGAPTLREALCGPCRDHLEAVAGLLSSIGIAAEEAPRLVRGFDYYTRTTFEYQSEALDAAQNALGGGGRYDGLVEQMGGPALPGIGFGLGVERILLAQEAAGTAAAARRLDCVLIPLDEEARREGFRLVAGLREEGIAADLAYGDRSLKAHLKHADRLGVRYTVISGPAERERGEVTMRDMTAGEQVPLPQRDVAKWIKERRADPGSPGG